MEQSVGVDTRKATGTLWVIAALIAVIVALGYQLEVSRAATSAPTTQQVVKVYPSPSPSTYPTSPPAALVNLPASISADRSPLLPYKDALPSDIVGTKWRMRGSPATLIVNHDGSGEFLNDGEFPLASTTGRWGYKPSQGCLEWWQVDDRTGKATSGTFCRFRRLAYSFGDEQHTVLY